MPQLRQLLLLPVAGIGAAAAILSAPVAAADVTGTNSQLPQCETVNGDSISGGQTTECATPGNTELNATPQQFPGEDEFYGFPAFGFW
ncbi:hypothetical protein [Mycolicibacterium helvum]|uniref:Intersectin-EH binding protein Ibp1 n=1 Tax=Mycolicibacterium helvum TaxID=1534349 RepID=A0A7I7T8D1_9MYCO|nr:hypothetical protein [Mycolicibacterium helvum]BBY65328.1 hypothetical protein MHEL_35710 [Mycolicibacterium helvum]